MPAGRWFRQNVSLAWVQGSDAPSAPASVYLHLFTTSASATAPGTAPTITGYAPQEMEPADWAALVEAADTDTLPSDIDLTYGPFSSSDESAVSWALMDGSNPATAHIITYDDFASPRTMANGGTLVIPAGDLNITA